uniref:Uncharacterized protein n=1 Tax=Anguilla anguilla TaxID=7936 RepID=A0A0E9QE39_ANGAN
MTVPFSYCSTHLIQKSLSRKSHLYMLGQPCCFAPWI